MATVFLSHALISLRAVSRGPEYVWQQSEAQPLNIHGNFIENLIGRTGTAFVDKLTAVRIVPKAIIDGPKTGDFKFVRSDVIDACVQFDAQQLTPGTYVLSLDVELTPWGSAAEPVWDFKEGWTVTLLKDDHVKLISDWVLRRLTWNAEAPAVVRLAARCLISTASAYLPKIQFGFRGAFAWDADVFLGLRIEAYAYSGYISNPAYQA